MTLVMLDIEPRTAKHLAVAVRRHRGSLPKHGLACPRELDDFEELVREIADGGQPPGAATVRAAEQGDLRDREYLSPSEVVTVTGLSLRTVQRRIGDGTLPSSLNGRTRRVARCDLEAFMRGAPPQ